MRLLLLLTLFCCMCGVWNHSASAQPLVAENEPMSPEEQRLKFHLPEGFEIQLVAAEPLIGQPMNLNFDAAGRLWVTSSIEYPYPTAGPYVQDRDPRFGKPSEHAPRDWVMVFEGIGPDGKPARSWRFAGGLNIPIGQVPLPDGAIVYSIPNIARMKDANGDGKVDSTESLYGPFGNVDTHGMTNSFTRWIDGWVYACHGFRNDTSVAGNDGAEMKLNSGNTFRFREDGSRVEQWTHGQVNPFGMTFDPYGNLYNADCHSMPITCLLRGAFYQSFGKPHDGLGFAPDMIDHNHGSTGICGVAWYAAPEFPEEYQDNVFICNPVTGRVHRDVLRWTGSTPKVDSQPDFIRCDDGWFRPVDVKLGPDGALYIADFYNAIIGHYEVPLEHPRRDREKGRIWRVVYTGTKSVPPNLRELSQEELLTRLGDQNFTVRTLATNEYIDRFRNDGSAAILKLLVDEGPPARRVGALWIAFRLGGMTDESLQLLSRDDSSLVRTHTARVLGEIAIWNAAQQQVASTLLRDGDALVRRAAADAIGRHPATEQVVPLIDALASCDPGDTHLRQTLRMAIRDHLAVDEIATAIDTNLTSAQLVIVAELSLGVQRPGAAVLAITARALSQVSDSAQRQGLEKHVLRYLARDRIAAAIAGIGESTEVTFPRLQGIRESLRQRGDGSEAELTSLAERLASTLIGLPSHSAVQWRYVTLDGAIDRESRFGVDVRKSADGVANGEFHCSFPRGEQGTGVYESEPFEMPERLEFFVVGHDGVPGKSAQGKNLVRLIDGVTGESLAEVGAPRSDIAQRVEWRFPASQGRSVRIEIVDRDDAGAYAWIGAGRFSVNSLNPHPNAPLPQALGLIAEFRLSELKPVVIAKLGNSEISLTERVACLRTLNSLSPDPRVTALLNTSSGSPLSATAVDRLAQGVVHNEGAAVDEVLEQTLRAGVASVQRPIALELASSRQGAMALLSLMEKGVASRRLLLDGPLKERLKSAGVEQVDEHIARLTEGLAPASAEIETLLEGRRKGFAQTLLPGDKSVEALQEQQRRAIANGREVFKQHCSACHQFQGEGAKIGPQLDGVGKRGSDRMLEDMIDPNRNVDAAFRSTTLVLNDGKVVSGLVRREEGATLILADDKGKEFSVLLSEIEIRKLSDLSLMPEKLAETIAEPGLYDLLHFLMSGK